MQPKLMLLDEFCQKRLDCRDMSKGLGAQKHAESPGDCNIESASDLPSVPFIDQEKAEVTFHGQRNGFGLARIEHGLKLCNQGAVTRSGDLQPAGDAGVRSRLRRARRWRESRSASNFLPDRRGDEDLAVPYSCRRRSDRPSAEKQISGEASLITTAILKILGEFLRAVVHRYLALRKHAIHVQARETGELRRLAQAENALGVKGHGQLQSQPLNFFPIRKAKRLDDFPWDFESQGFRHAAHRSRVGEQVQDRKGRAARLVFPI
jgi:hypothetical protein